MVAPIQLRPGILHQAIHQGLEVRVPGVRHVTATGTTNGATGQWMAIEISRPWIHWIYWIHWMIFITVRYTTTECCDACDWYTAILLQHSSSTSSGLFYFASTMNQKWDQECSTDTSGYICSWPQEVGQTWQACVYSISLACGECQAISGTCRKIAWCCCLRFCSPSLLQHLQ